MDAEGIRKFFLKSESYCSIELPTYFCFKEILLEVDEIIEGAGEDSGLYKIEETKKSEDVNHKIFQNKDSKYGWRPLQIIHPVLYVRLVRQMTEPQAWKELKEVFQNNQHENIVCTSMPVESCDNNKDKASQIQKYWTDFEQESIKLALEYTLCFQSDIENCYGSIYTHSIPWAIYGKDEAKKKKNCKELIGNKIDESLRHMSYGQTNGIPQGSVLMDFIAEIVLSSADKILSKKIKNNRICKYRILRYRDDYRIFVNSSQDGERILTLLMETLMDLGLKLNTSKTRGSEDIISSSTKKEKRDWIGKKQQAKSLQEQLLLIRQHGLLHPNAGSLFRSLNAFHEKILEMEDKKWGYYDLDVLISIVVDIAHRNPKTYPNCTAILSKLINKKGCHENHAIFNKIHERFKGLPNTNYMEIWLQRIKLAMSENDENESDKFNEKLCKIIYNSGDEGDLEIWKNEWISSNDFERSYKSKKYN